MLLGLYCGYYFNRMIFFCLIALYQRQISYRIDREMRIHVNIVRNDFERIVCFFLRRYYPSIRLERPTNTVQQVQDMRMPSQIPTEKKSDCASSMGQRV
jgi:hypothetical protein